MDRARLASIVSAYGALAVAACLLAPLVGSTHISLARAFDRSIPFADNVDAQIFFIARMPRVLTGAIVGATLAAAATIDILIPPSIPFILFALASNASIGALFIAGILPGLMLCVGFMAVCYFVGRTKNAVVVGRRDGKRSRDGGRDSGAN